MSNSPAQKLKSKPAGLLNSPLLRPIIGAFLLLVALELALVFYLLHDIQQAEQTALKEYQYLNASERWSDCADLMRAHRRVVDATRKSDNLEEAKAEHDASCLAVRKATAAWKNACERTQKLDSRPIREAIESCLYCTTEMYDRRKTAAARERWYLGYLNASRRMYEKALVQIRTIHAAIGDQKPSQYQEEFLLGTFLTVDLIICFFLASFIEKQISKPLSQLAEGCKKLTTREILAEPSKHVNEIDSLQQTFHDMSVRINQHEQGRRSYIELFKEMHSSRLLRIQQFIGELTRQQTEIKVGKLEILESNANRTLYLLDTMTQGLSFNDAVRLTPKFERQTSTELFQTVHSTLAFMLRSKSIDLKVEDPACNLWVDSHLLTRAITNLLGNACKFSPKSSEIALAGRCDGKTFRCEVTDRGPGISQAQQQKLFKRFSQLKQTQGGGSGLGLLIAKQIVESHNGTIGCTSEEGKGTTFWFEIPINPDAKPGSSAEHAAAQSDKNTEIHNEKIGSIRTRFIAILIVFVIAQFVIAFQLNSSLQQAAAKANSYARQKTSILKTQKLLAIFLSSRQRSYEAALQRDKAGIVALIPLFHEQTFLAKSLVDSAQDKSKAKEIFASIYKKMIKLDSLGPKIMSIESLPPIQAFPLLTIADETGKHIENDLFKALQVQNVVLDRSYNLTSELRATVSQLLITTLVVNTIFLLVLFFVCINIIERLAQVNAKAVAFTQGDDPKVSVKGNDELSVLDKSLCSAAHSIREAERQRRELIAIINHDLRTPLSAMLMGFELMSMERAGQESSITDAQRQKMEQTNRDIQFLIKQISDLLDLEKMESGALQPDSADIAIDELLEDTIDTIKRQQNTPIELVKNGNTDNLLVRGELSLLQRIFESLVHNAQSYSLDGSPIKVSISSDDSWAIINVSDKGPGIDRELLGHIFDRFRFSGGKPITGVGIPLAYRLARIHGGKLEINSSPGAGTDVMIFLPRIIRQN